MKVKCPKCQKQVPWEKNAFRPFCSERCKLLDLGKWVEGEYRVQGESVNVDHLQDNVIPFPEKK